MADENWNAGCGHSAYQAMSDCMSDQLPCSEYFQDFDGWIEDLELGADDIKKMKDIPEIGLILKNSGAHKPWFLGFDCARDLRSFSVYCDVDRFGDTEYFGFHPDPKKFLADLEALEQSIIEKISACGIDLDDV